MANIKSSAKRNLINEKARQRNQSVKSGVKTALRKFRETAATGDRDKTIELQRDAARKLDKAVSKGVIHKNQAANKKAAMARRANEL